MTEKWLVIGMLGCWTVGWLLIVCLYASGIRRLQRDNNRLSREIFVANKIIDDLNRRDNFKFDLYGEFDFKKVDKVKRQRLFYDLVRNRF